MAWIWQHQARARRIRREGGRAAPIAQIVDEDLALRLDLVTVAMKCSGLSALMASATRLVNTYVAPARGLALAVQRHAGPFRLRS